MDREVTSSGMDLPVLGNRWGGRLYTAWRNPAGGIDPGQVFVHVGTEPNVLDLMLCREPILHIYARDWTSAQALMIQWKKER